MDPRGSQHLNTWGHQMSSVCLTGAYEKQQQLLFFLRERSFEPTTDGISQVFVGCNHGATKKLRRWHSCLGGARYHKWMWKLVLPCFAGFLFWLGLLWSFRKTLPSISINSFHVWCSFDTCFTGWSTTTTQMCPAMFGDWWWWRQGAYLVCLRGLKKVRISGL